MTDILPCIRCRKPLASADPDGINHPVDGTAFSSEGHYGSMFDPMDGSRIVINVCDACLMGAGNAGLVLQLVPPASFTPPIVSRWQP